MVMEDTVQFCISEKGNQKICCCEQLRKFWLPFCTLQKEVDYDSRKTVCTADN